MSLENGLESLKRGEFVLLFDSAGRENEIDMVVAAEFITPEHVARMRQNAGGLLCIALENNFAKSLEKRFVNIDYINLQKLDELNRDLIQKNLFG